MFMSRSSRLEVCCRKGVLRNFAKFTGKHLCQSLFFNKLVCICEKYFYLENSQCTGKTLTESKLSCLNISPKVSENNFEGLPIKCTKGVLRFFCPNLDKRESLLPMSEMCKIWFRASRARWGISKMCSMANSEYW